MLLGIGLLVTWKQIHVTGNSRTQNRYQCSLKCFRQMTACKTCRLALLVFLLISGSDMTSAKLRKPQKPQLQTYFEGNRTHMMQNAIILTGVFQFSFRATARKVSTPQLLLCEHETPITNKKFLAPSGRRTKSSACLRQRGEILQYKCSNFS